MFKNIIFQILFLYIESRYWYNEITGFDINDPKKGYAGDKSKSMTDFYLCGGRTYRVHFIGDSPNNWSEEHAHCDPVGNGRKIDGISISGGKRYTVRIKNNYRWLGLMTGYNINDSKNGYAGILGEEITGIAVEGGSTYRFGFGPYSSNIKDRAQDMAKNLFGFNIGFNYDLYSTVIENEKVKIEGKLILSTEIKSDGQIKFIIKDGEIVDSDLAGFIGDDLNKILHTLINIDVNLFKYSLEKHIGNGIHHGNVAINCYFIQQKIEIDIGNKIEKDDVGFKGGVRIVIHFKTDKDYFNKIKKVLEFLNKTTKIIKDSFKNILNSLNPSNLFNNLSNIQYIVDTVTRNLIIMSSLAIIFIPYIAIFVF